MEQKILTDGTIDKKPYANRVKEMADVMGSYMRAIVGGADDTERYQSFEELYDELVSLINAQIDRKMSGKERQESPI